MLEPKQPLNANMVFQADYRELTKDQKANAINKVKSSSTAWNNLKDNDPTRYQQYMAAYALKKAPWNCKNELYKGEVL
jgi:hypothetical protein